MGFRRKNVCKSLGKIIKGEKGQGSLWVFAVIGSTIIVGVLVFALYTSMAKTVTLSMNESVEEVTSAIRTAAQDAAGMPEAVAESVNESADDGDPKGKETICHIPPGKPGNAKTMKVEQDDVPAHLGHGDYLGPCKNDKKKEKG